jgi:hypothetical protein
MVQGNSLNYNIRMRNKFLMILSLVCLFGSAVAGADAQSFLNINCTDGSEKKINLETIGKITFSGTNMILNYLGGNSEPMDMTIIKNIVFNKPTSISETTSNSFFSIYPNPVSNYLCFKNVPSGDLNISVYSLSGTVVLKLQVSSSLGQIDVSGLAKGFYLLKVNDRIFKFSKL